MGLFGSMFGWDQSMGAMNAVMASYLFEHADDNTRKLITNTIVSILGSTNRSKSLNETLDDLGKQPRVVQMNFIALACDILGIDPPCGDFVWARLKNPYETAHTVKDRHIDVAVELVKKTTSVHAPWPGNDARIDFKGHSSPIDLFLAYSSSSAR